MTLSLFRRGCSSHTGSVWRVALSAFLFSSLLLSSPNGASAQGAPLFQLVPSIAVTEEYSDNFDRTQTNKRDNFRTLATPGLTLKINGAKTKGEIGGSASYSHDTVDKGNDVFYSGLAGVTWQPNPRFSLLFNDTLSRNDVPGLTGTLGVRRGRSTFTSNTATLTSNYLIGNVQTQGSYSNVIFDDKSPTGEDTLTHNMGVTVGTTILQTNTVSVGYTHSISNFTRSPDAKSNTFTALVSRLVGPFTTVGLTGSYSLISSAPLGTDTKIFSAAVTGSHAIPRGFSATARAGYSRLEQSPGGNENSFNGGLSLSYQFAKATVIVAYDQGFVPTFTTGTGENFGVVQNRQFSATLTYPVTPFITTSLNGFYAHNEFSGGIATTAAAATGRTTESTGANVDLGVQLLRWLRMTVGYGFEHFNSNVFGEDFNENKGRVSFAASF